LLSLFFEVVRASIRLRKRQARSSTQGAFPISFPPLSLFPYNNACCNAEGTLHEGWRVSLKPAQVIIPGLECCLVVCCKTPDLAYTLLSSPLLGPPAPQVPLSSSKNRYRGSLQLTRLVWLSIIKSLAIVLFTVAPCRAAQDLASKASRSPGSRKK
jgi:hypothetical protein